MDAIAVAESRDQARKERIDRLIRVKRTTYEAWRGLAAYATAFARGAEAVAANARKEALSASEEELMDIANQEHHAMEMYALEARFDADDAAFDATTMKHEAECRLGRLKTSVECMAGDSLMSDFRLRHWCRPEQELVAAHFFAFPRFRRAVALPSVDSMLPCAGEADECRPVRLLPPGTTALSQSHKENVDANSEKGAALAALKEAAFVCVGVVWHWSSVHVVQQQYSLPVDTKLRFIASELRPDLRFVVSECLLVRTTHPPPPDETSVLLLNDVSPFLQHVGVGASVMESNLTLEDLRVRSGDEFHFFVPSLTLYTRLHHVMLDESDFHPLPSSKRARNAHAYEKLPAIYWITIDPRKRSTYFGGVSWMLERVEYIAAASSVADRKRPLVLGDVLNSAENPRGYTPTGSDLYAVAVLPQHPDVDRRSFDDRVTEFARTQLPAYSRLLYLSRVNEFELGETTGAVFVYYRPKSESHEPHPIIAHARAGHHCVCSAHLYKSMLHASTIRRQHRRTRDLPQASSSSADIMASSSSSSSFSTSASSSSESSSSSFSCRRGNALRMLSATP